MNIIQPIIKRIPGEIPPLPKKSSQGYIDDLSKNSKPELLEFLARQEKLLTKGFALKMPDKGARVKNFIEKIKHELESRDKVEEAAKLLSRLNIATEGKAAMNELEWTGKYSEHSNGHQKIVELDSDDEEDPLKILAQPTGTGAHKKKIIHLAPEESLIKPEDLKEIESFKTPDPVESEHVKYIVNKVDNPESEKKREREYRPYKTTKSNVHDPEKEKQRGSKKGKHWEVTAATPPTIIHGAVKVLDLNESLRLQKEQDLRMKGIQQKHAEERLAQQLGIHRLGNIPSVSGNYRSNNKDSESSGSENEEDYPEVHDEEDNDKSGTVVFTVDSLYNA